MTRGPKRALTPVVEPQVVGYGWQGGGQDSVQVLRLYGADDLRLAGRIAFGLTDRRQCIGWRTTAGGRRACPARAIPSSAQCVACSRREGFWECMTCDGFHCPPLQASMLDYCRSTHVLYLANFGGHQNKVGTASSPRRIARLVDQGPLLAAHIAEGPGPVIKQMEALVVRMGYLESLRRSRKWQEYQQPRAESAAAESFERSFADIRERLPASYHDLLYEAPKLVRVPYTLPPHLELIRVDPGDRIGGEVVGGRGHVCVLNDGAGPFAIDLGALRSWFIDLDPPDTGGPVRQLGLF